MHSENLLLPHGGRLNEAVLKYGIPRSDWLDLSTGISPWSWPVPAIPESCWARLPEEDEALQNSARQFYATPHILPVAGSQAAIQALPRLRPACRVGVLRGSYAEHAHAWSMCGHQIVYLQSDEIEQVVGGLDVLILVRPDNPTGRIVLKEDIFRWHFKLARRQGWLIIDEAFVDMTNGCSLASHTYLEGLIVLRSLGKFFGLAGARTGFVCAQKHLLDHLRAVLGPWSISGPAGFVAHHALQDVSWHTIQRTRLQQSARQLVDLLIQNELSPQGQTTLFAWVPVFHADTLHHQLAQQGILTRLFEWPSALRFGLPPNKAAWQRLKDALQKCQRDNK